MAYEYFIISNIKFSVILKNEYVFVNSWMHFILAFLLFEIIGMFLFISSYFARRQLLSRTQLSFIYSCEVFVVLASTALLVFDLQHQGISLSGSNMIGIGVMERATSSYLTFAGNLSVFDVVKLMHIVINIASTLYVVTVISNSIIFTYIPLNYVRDVGEDYKALENIRNLYFRNLYGMGALLTVGVLQLAAWIGLPTENIVERQEFVNFVTSITIYMSVLFSLIAVSSAGMSALDYNEKLRSYVGPEVYQKLSINMFDKALIIGVFLPTVAGYLFKAVPWLVGG